PRPSTTAPVTHRRARPPVDGRRSRCRPLDKYRARPRLAVPPSGPVRLQRPRLRSWCWNVAMGRAGNGTRREIGRGDPEALLPRDRAHGHRRAIARIALAVTLAAAAWVIAFLPWSTEPAGYDFVAFYSAARLVATGSAFSVTDANALLAMEHATLPERTILLNNPNPPALALLMAPLGALPFMPAYAIWSALAAAALAAAAYLLGQLADARQRMRLLPFAILAPPSLIALTAG